MPALVKISRQDAYTRGLKRFYTGEPCKHGHIAERFVVNGGCVECTNWRTNKGSHNVRGANVGWPPRAIVFNVDFVPTADEIQAAFLYAEAQRWLDRALYDVHNDATLLARYAKPLTDDEAARATVLLERRRAFYERVHAEAQGSTTAGTSEGAREHSDRCRYCGSDGGGPAYLDLHEQVCPQRPKV